MLISNYEAIEDFAIRHNINSNNIRVMKSHGTIPGSIFYKERKKPMKVDASFFERRQAFKSRARDESIDNYYFLTKHMSQFYIAEILYKIDSSNDARSWNHFMQVSLFGISEDNILKINMSVMAYKFLRYSRWLIRGAFIISNVKPEHRDVSIIWDDTVVKWSIKEGGYVRVPR